MLDPKDKKKKKRGSATFAVEDELVPAEVSPASQLQAGADFDNDKKLQQTEQQLKVGNELHAVLLILPFGGTKRKRLKGSKGANF